MCIRARAPKEHLFLKPNIRFCFQWCEKHEIWLQTKQKLSFFLFSCCSFLFYSIIISIFFCSADSKFIVAWILFSRKLHSRQHARANFQQVKPKTYCTIDENKLLESSAPWCCKLKRKSTLSLPLNNENISLQVVFSFSPTKIPAELTMLIAIHEAEKKRRWDQCEWIN